MFLFLVEVTMKKATLIIIIVSSIILVLGLCFGTLYGLLYSGIPLDNPIALGSSSIEIPANLTDDGKALSVMSFNIRCFTKEAEEINYWTNRKDAVLALILNYSPDIIGFQEVTHPQYLFLMEELGDLYGYYGSYRSGLNVERANFLIKTSDPKVSSINTNYSSMISEASPIFYKKSRFEVVDHDMFWLSETPEKPSKGWDAKLKRIATYLEFKDHYTDNTVHFVNTHFDHMGDAAKLNSAKLINDYIGDRSNFIVVGDFNSMEGTEPYTELLSKTLVNSKYCILETERSNGPTSNGYGTFKEELPIDHIFLQNTYSAQSYLIIEDKRADGNYISDHFPILVNLGYK